MKKKSKKSKNDANWTLVQESGFHFFHPAFDDAEMDRAFWRLQFSREDKTWNGLLKVLLLVIAIFLGLYFYVTDKVNWIVVGALIALELVVFVARLATTIEREVNHHMPVFLISCGQTAALITMLFAKHPEFLSPIAFLCIMVGGYSSNKFKLQAVTICYPALFYLAVVFKLNLYADNIGLYHVLMCLIGVSMTISRSYLNERAQRLEFLLTKKTGEALARADLLLNNVLPATIAGKIRELPTTSASMVESFDCATVLFADLVGFTKFTSSHPASHTVQVLSDLFRRFDAIADYCGIEKIKTMGDAYLAVSGLPERTSDHTDRIANAAFEMREAVKKFRHLTGIDFEIRLGIHRGPLIAGIIGTKKFQYDIWGDTVNVAARLESQGVPGAIQVSREVADSLADRFLITSRGKIDLKGKGLRDVFILERPLLPEERSSTHQAS